MILRYIAQQTTNCREELRGCSDFRSAAERYDRKMEKKIRILIAKVGCDIHERGARTMMHAFREAGMEVIYTGRFHTEEGVVNAAVAEDVNLIAVSDLTGSLPIISEKILSCLKVVGADIPLIVGGLMNDEDIKKMETMGVKACFGTGYPVDECVKKVLEITGR